MTNNEQQSEPLHIEIIKGNASEDERDAVIAAVIVLAIGAAAMSDEVLRHQTRPLSAWRMATDTRLGIPSSYAHTRHQTRTTRLSRRTARD